MTFNPNIPQPTDDLSDSQGDLLNNNLALDASFSINHAAFSDTTADNGKHTYVEMLNNGAIPAGLASGQGTIYVKSILGRSQLFYSPGNTTNEYQITRTITPDYATFAVNTGAGTSGWTFLPGNLLMQWGIGSGSSIVTYPVAFTSDVFNVQLTMIRNSTNKDVLYVKPGTVTTTAFQVIDTSSGNSFYWMAIGL